MEAKYIGPSPNSADKARHLIEVDTKLLAALGQLVSRNYEGLPKSNQEILLFEHTLNMQENHCIVTRLDGLIESLGTRGSAFEYALGKRAA